MKFLKRIFAFYISSSLHVSLSVVALTAITVLQYHLTVPLELWSFIFLGAIVGYNFVKFAEPTDGHFLESIEASKSIFAFTLFCFLLLIYTAFHLTWPVLTITVLFAAITFCYAVPMIESKNLRNLSGLKILIVALVWAGVTVLLPIVASGKELDWEVGFTFLERVLIVLVLIIPFEIRDIQCDSKELKTLPQHFGIRRTKFFGEAVLLLILLIEWKIGFGREGYLLGTILFIVLLSSALFLSKIKQNEYFSSFWVESLPMVWLISIVVFGQFLLV